jgi:hypothetical protein
LVDLLDHVLLAGDLPILVHTVDVVLVRDEAWLVRVAVLADVDRGAFLAIVVTSGSVDGASLISDVLLVDECEGVEGSTSVATIISSIARYDHLGRDVDVRPGSSPCNLYSVRKSRSGSVGPARSAVLGDVLVSNVGEVVGAINSVPDESFWHIRNRGEGFLHYGHSITRVLLSAWVHWVHILELGLFFSGC